MCTQKMGKIALGLALMMLILVVSGCNLFDSTTTEPESVTITGEFDGEDAVLVLVNPANTAKPGSGYELLGSTNGPQPSRTAQDFTGRTMSPAAPDGEAAFRAYLRDTSRQVQEDGRYLRSHSSARSASSSEEEETYFAEGLTTNPDWANNVGSQQRVIHVSPTKLTSETEQYYSEATDDNGDPVPGTINTTLRAHRGRPLGSGEVNLYVWVADHSWEGGSKENLLNQNQVDAMADRFLNDSDENIFTWVTDILGDPWGDDVATAYDNYIDFDENEHIHIVLYDVNDDEATDGGIVGYFWSINNLRNLEKDVTENGNVVAEAGTLINPGGLVSNQGLYFFMDSVLFGQADGDQWDDTDRWPQSVFSTLAHEFQHMINFYHTQIQDRFSDTWLDELASMAIEDIVADKLVVPGPRGVPLANGAFDYSPGPDEILSGRLSAYAYYPERSLLVWDEISGDNVYYDYAVSYAFGAYLMRAYGGPEIIRDIVQHKEGDMKAVVDVVSQADGPNNAADILLDFGEAVLQSKSKADIVKLRVNNLEEGFNYQPLTGSTVNYRLGSIDIFNYHWLDQNADKRILWINDSEYSWGEDFEPASKTFIGLGDNLSGSHSWEVLIPDGMVYRLVKADVF